MQSQSRAINELLRAISLLLATLWVLWCGPAQAQAHAAAVAQMKTQTTPAQAAPPATREEAREMVSMLSDEAVRALLLEHLDRSLPTAAKNTSSATQPWLLTGNNDAVTRFNALLARRGELDDEFDRLWSKISNEQQRPWLSVLGSVLLCLLAGAVLERVMLRPGATLGGLRALGRSPAGERLSANQVLLEATARSAGALLFLLGALGALHLLPGLNADTRVLISAILWLVGASRVFATAIHALLLPQGGTSPWPLSIAVARCIARYLSIVVTLILLLQINRDLLEQLGAQLFFITSVNLLLSTSLIAAILIAIFAVRRTMGPRASRAQLNNLWEMLQDRWHYLAAAYVLAVYGLSVYARVLSGESVLLRALASFALLLVVPMLDHAIRALAAHLAPSVEDAEDSSLPVEDARVSDAAHAAPVADVPSPDEVASGRAIPLDAIERADSPDATERAASLDMTGQALAHTQGAQAAAPPHAESTIDAAQGEQQSGAPEPALLRDALVVNFRILLVLGLVQLMGMLWGVRIFDLVESVFGTNFAAALFEVLIAGLFAFIVWRVLKAALIAYAPPDLAGESDGEIGGMGLTRTQTLMPLIANIIGAALALMLVLIGLSALGVNIAPLLAGAGIVGLAIGFGAQTLVKDIVSGVFFLVDDAFRMGEYLEIGDIRGTVERIAVRSLRMRHHRGALHTVPYGEIGHITNYSRDFAIMKFEVRVPFETDVEKVRKLIKRVGAQLMENEEVAPVMLEPLKSQGVNRMDDSAFVIRCKFMTLPGKQFTVRRFAYAMIQEAFAAEGILFAPKRVIVETTAPPGSREALAAAAAAAQANEEPEPEARDDR